MWSRWNDNKNAKNSRENKKENKVNNVTPLPVPIVQASDTLFPLDEENPDTWI